MNLTKTTTVFVQVEDNKLVGMTIAELLEKMEEKPARKTATKAKAAPKAEPVNIRDHIGEMTYYMEDGVRRGAIIEKVGKRRGEIVVQLVNGQRISEQEAIEGLKVKPKLSERAEAEGGGAKAKVKAKPVEKEEPKEPLLVKDVRGQKVRISYKWGGKVSHKTVTVDKVVNRDGVRTALAGDLAMEFDKIERVGSKLDYTGRVAKADFEAA